MRDVLLAEYIEKTAQEKFVWGQCDCILWVCSWAEKLCGKNPADGSYGAYSNAAEAKRHLKKVYGSAEEGFDKYFSRVAPAYAQKGDIVLALVNGNKTAGIMAGNGACWFKTEQEGVINIPAQILIAWGVR